MNETTGAGPASARSPTALGLLGARRGHELGLRARGPDAQRAVEALVELARGGFGERVEEPSAASLGRPGERAALSGRTARPGRPPPRQRRPLRPIRPPRQRRPRRPSCPLRPRRPPRAPSSRALPPRPASRSGPRGAARQSARASAGPVGRPGGRAAGARRGTGRRAPSSRGRRGGARAAGGRRGGGHPRRPAGLLDDPALFEPARSGDRRANAGAAAFTGPLATPAGTAPRRSLPRGPRRTWTTSAAGCAPSWASGTPPSRREPGILVAYDLAPADAARLDPAAVLGMPPPGRTHLARRHPGARARRARRGRPGGALLDSPRAPRSRSTGARARPPPPGAEPHDRAGGAPRAPRRGRGRPLRGPRARPHAGRTARGGRGQRRLARRRRGGGAGRRGGRRAPAHGVPVRRSNDAA